MEALSILTGQTAPFGSARTLAIAIAMLLPSACAPKSETAASAPVRVASSITVSVGPCFGFCPVYGVTISADGRVVFKGERHTAVLGERERSAGRVAYDVIATELAPFRPASGFTAVVACDSTISDTSIYTITWTDAEGGTANATHQRGCSGGAGKALDEVLGKLPDQLGIGGWARQSTRPGTSRG